MAHHDLKIIPEHYKSVFHDKEKCQVRFNDRNFEVGDTITFYEGQQELTGFSYSGWSISCSISHISTYGLQDGFVCLSLDNVGMLIINRGEK